MDSDNGNNSSSNDFTFNDLDSSNNSSHDSNHSNHSSHSSQNNQLQEGLYEWEMASTSNSNTYSANLVTPATSVNSATSANNTNNIVANVPPSFISSTNVATNELQGNVDEYTHSIGDEQNNNEQNNNEQISLDLRDDVVQATYDSQAVLSSNDLPFNDSTQASNNVDTYAGTYAHTNQEIANVGVNDIANGYPESSNNSNSNDSNPYDDSVIDRNLIDNSTGNNGNGESGINNNGNNSNQDKGATDANKDPFNLEDDNQLENILPLSQSQSVKERAIAKITPGGDLSKRIIGVALFVVVGLLVVWGGAKEKQTENTANNKTQAIKPVPIEKSTLSNTLNSPDIGQSPTPLQTVNEQVAATPTVVETVPPVIIPAPPPAPPPIGSGDIPITITEPVKVEKASRQYAFQLRAGQQVMKSYEQQQIQQLQAQQTLRKEDSSDSSKGRSITRGTVIPMMMVQPFRNDLPGIVKCQVMVDVKDSKGVLLVPAGSIASVPFAPFRNNKRVFNRVDSPTVITLADSREIELKGTVIDRKGFVGLEGKVRRSGDANFAKRVGRTMAKVLTFGAASAVGGVGGGVIAEAGNSTVDSTYFYTAATGSYVELPVGTLFIFNVSGN